MKPGWAVAALLIPLALLMLTLGGALSSQKMSQAAMSRATVAAAGPARGLTDDLPGLQALVEFTSSERAHVWLLSLVGSLAVGLSGIFPLLVIPVEAGAALKTEGKTLLLGLLGFPFLQCPFLCVHSRQRGTYASFRFSCSDKKGACRGWLPADSSAHTHRL